MVASFPLAVNVIFWMLLSVMPTLHEAKKCSDEGVLDWTADSCVFVVNIHAEEYAAWKPVHTTCRALSEVDNGSRHPWHLPTLDSIEKQKILYRIIGGSKKIVPEGTVFWTNLVRDYPSINESWSDPTKWYWTSRKGGRGHKIFEGGKLPWAEKQPDNAAAANVDPRNKREWLDHLEKCVVAKMKPTSPWFEWYDEPCYKDGNDAWNESFRVLCEGYKISPPMNPSTTTASANTDQHPLVWIIVGLVLVIVLLSAITTAVACRDRIRRCKRRIWMTWHRSWGDQSFDRFWSDSTKIPTGSSTERRRHRRSEPNQLKN